MAFTLCGPLILSFDKKVAFYKDWKFYLWSMIPTSIFYILWDIIKTHTHVWSFNSKYLLGINFINLPLEEYLFFLVVPYACLFIYACIKSYFPLAKSNRASQVISITLILISAIAIAQDPTHAYTSSTFGLLTITIIALHTKKFTHHLSHTYLAWIIALLPMAFVNGILTGNPVVIYDDTENLGIRIGTIPFEDFFYNLLYMIWMISLFEYFKQRTQK